MAALALNVQMHGKLAVIIGGGSVANRKLRTLIKAGAAVTVVAPEICPEIRSLENPETVTIRVGSYCAEDLDRAFMVIAATNDTGTNEQVRVDARKRNILVATADNPSAGDCTFPATLQRGDLHIAVSTGGLCPTFAVDVRDRIAEHIGTEFAGVLEQLAIVREKLLTDGSSSTYNTEVLRSLAKHLLDELSKRKESLL